MKKLCLLMSVLWLAGCAAVNDSRPYYACYYGEHMLETCQQTAVPEGRQRVCVDMVKPAGMRLSDCDKQVKKDKKGFSWF